jgi:hypothetical protein
MPLPMPNYRIFLFDRDESRFVSAEVVSCRTDDCALAKASKLVTSQYGAEVWAHGRIVGTLPPEEGSASSGGPASI